MSLTNAAYNSAFHWADPALESLEAQAKLPFLTTEPVELGWADDIEGLIQRLESLASYPELFALAFPDEADPVNFDNIARAIASFERTLLSYNSPFDRFSEGDRDAMSPSAVRGLELFFSEQLECFHCHGGFNFTESVVHEGSAFQQGSFQNTGLYNVDGRGAYPDKDRGLIDITGVAADMGRFRAPTLRNIAVTAPYMHDGSVPDLDAAIDHYARGGRLISEGPYAGDGRLSIVKSGFVQGFGLSPEQREDLKAFLQALTDDEFLNNPNFQAP